MLSWRGRVAGGGTHSAVIRKALEALIQPAFGLPGAPGVTDHVEGLVAEHIWYELTTENGAVDGVVLVTEPGFRATSPGGDGLVIHRANGAFSYRLWELKKAASGNHVSATTSTAYKQLDANAAKYLAQYTAFGQHSPDAALAHFFSTLVDQWLLRAPTAAAGIAVHTSRPGLPKRCFTTFGTRFPDFTHPVRLRGVITAVDDFSLLVSLVQGAVWSGL